LCNTKNDKDKNTGSRSGVKIVIRNICKKDIPRIVGLQRESFPDITTGMISAPSFLENHIRDFPQGQFCVEFNGEVVASATCLIVLLEPEYVNHTWYDITGHGRITRHNPRGDSLYADDISTHPNFRRLGIATMLFNARKELAMKLNLRRIIGGGRLFNYCEYADKMSAHEYAEKVVRGEIQDPVLSFQLKNGFKCIKIIPDYLYDSRSLNYATFIEWLNPKYHA
jgi:GNAT superfamily N-acetyltransferase